MTKKGHGTPRQDPTSNNTAPIENCRCQNKPLQSINKSSFDYVQGQDDTKSLKWPELSTSDSQVTLLHEFWTSNSSSFEDNAIVIYNDNCSAQTKSANSRICYTMTLVWLPKHNWFRMHCQHEVSGVTIAVTTFSILLQKMVVDKCE